MARLYTRRAGAQRSRERRAPAWRARSCRPHPSRHGYETTTRRPSRHCSWARWARLSSLAIRPHPSRQRPRIHGHESGQLDTPSQTPHLRHPISDTPSQTPHCAVGQAIKVGGSPLPSVASFNSLGMGKVCQIVTIWGEVQMKENKKCAVSICKSLKINEISFLRVRKMD